MKEHSDVSKANTFTDEDLKRFKTEIEAKDNSDPWMTWEIAAALIARLEAAESALDSYDRLYHAYDDESLDEYKRWRKVAGK